MGTICKLQGNGIKKCDGHKKNMKTKTLKQTAKEMAKPLRFEALAL
jgi:hypothetical protein